MKYLIVLVILFSFGCDRQSSVIPPPTIFNPNLIEGVNESVEPTLVTPESIVFIGDSLTHIGWWASYFPKIKTANQGIGGNTTFDVLNRIQPIIDIKPKKIFLLIGANDYNFGVHQYIIATNIEKIVKKIIDGSPETELYLQTIMPFGEGVRDFFPQIPKTFKEDINNINIFIRLIGNRYETNITILDTYNVMVNDNGYLKDGFSIDRIHLEEPGYRAWVDFLYPHVK